MAHTGNREKPVARNELEIQFFGLQRSGNHAVLAWLFQQFDRPVHFFNNVAHFTDPVLNFRYVSLPNMVPVSRGPSGDDPLCSESRRRTQRRLEEIRGRQKELLIYSYENLRLQKLADRDLVQARSQTLGNSKNFRRVLLLRDFYNWIASRIRLLENKTQQAPLKRGVDAHISLWIAYAREFAGETQLLGEDGVVRISYNEWLRNESYRAGLLDRIGAPNKNNCITHIPEAGGGSSFDGRSLSAEPGLMRVHERWRYLLDSRFSEVTATILERRDQIASYNSAIFGLPPPF